MKPEVIIQQATSADFPLVAEIYNEYIPLGAVTMETDLQTAENIAGWVAHFHDREKLYVLKEDGVTVGWGIIKRYSDRGGYQLSCETAVYLTSDKLYKGYGSLLKKHLIKVCKQLNYKHLVAKINAKNKASIAYNENLGYTIVGIQNQVGYKNGEWVDVCIMQYLIT